MRYKIPSFLILLSFISAFPLFHPSLIYAADQPDQQTIECSSTLLGTSSEEHCEKICKNGGTEYKCMKVPGILDKECYTCARDQYCSDLGFMTLWDCGPCDANPLTECVPAGVTLPGIGGTIGGKTWSGVQCYKCQAKPDRCNQRWPGSSWLASCQANCPAPKTCVLAGMHQGNWCYKCQDGPKTCKDMGFLDQAGCNACDKNPKTQCIFSGLDENFKACFSCVARNLPPQPPPPPRNCREAGFLDNCNSCISQGKGCNFISIAPDKICAQCYDRPVPKRCEPPSLNADECADCIKRGGQCIPMTQVRGDPPCYTCYIPPAPKQGCAKYSMFSSCSPNPCSASEECTIVQPEPNLSCAACVYKEGPEDTTCEERNMWPDCSACYRAQMACRNVFLPDKNMWCSRCYTPDDNRQCGDGEWPGACSESSCPSNQECFDTNDGCHRCEGKGTCSDRGYLNCNKDCAACEQDPAMICRSAWFLKDDGNCCECVHRPVTEICEQGAIPGACPGSCTSQQECKDVGNHCHACLDKDDKCEKFGAMSSCQPDPCNPETEVCDNLTPDPKPGLYCYACKSKADWCSEYGDYHASCDPNPCSKGERCVMTGVTMSSIECAKCISKEEDENMCEKYELADGACTSSTCSTGFQCNDIDIYGNKCHKCECEHGTYSGGCSAESCYEGEACIETVPGQCHRCDSAGTCRENNLYSCESECVSLCENQGDRKCVPANINKSDGACCRCVPRLEEECRIQGAAPGLCPGGCRSNQECRNVGDGCHVCLEKEDTCEKYGALSSCNENSCNPETEVCDNLNPGPKPGLYCYGCKLKAEWCSEYGDYHASCDPNPCKKGERCVLTGVTMSSVECAKCISKEEDEKMCEKYELADGVCTSSTCSAGFECNDVDILGNKCHECRCEHGTNTGGCSAESCYEGETCVETVPGQCHRCDSSGTCRENNLYNCQTECGECEEYGDNKCVPAGISKSDGACCRCVNRINAECPKDSSPGVCPRGCHNDEICVDVADKCHRCVKKTAECPQGTATGACTSSSCSSDQKCVDAGGNCHTCQPKDCADLGHLTSCIICDVDNHDCQEIHPREGLTCYECINNPCSPNLNKDQCAECERQGGVCKPMIAPMQTRTRGTPECFTCEPRPLECPQGSAQGACTPSSCSSQEECVPAGEICHRCQAKKKTCEDMGLSDGETCARTCQDGTCVQGRADDYETRCWECQKTTIQPACNVEMSEFFGTCPANCSADQVCEQISDACFKCNKKPVTQPPRCDQGYQPGTCPGICSSQQECVQAGQCYTCRTKKQTCEDMGLMYGDGCMQSGCIEKGGKCVQKSQDEYGMTCWECQTAQGCTPGYEPGGCFGMGPVCGFGYYCHQDDKLCHKCVPVDSGPCAGKGLPGPCPGYCSAGEECVPVDNECHTCRERPRTTPNDTDGGGGGTGGGIGVIPGSGWGVGTDYDWKDKYKNGLGLGYDYTPGVGVIPGGGGTTTTQKACKDYELADNCLPCRLMGMTCSMVQVDGVGTCAKCEPNRCAPDYYTWEECEECEDDDGYCVPAKVDTEARLYGTAECYKCVQEPKCEDYGTFCNCALCPQGTTCIPAGRLETGKMCYHCVRGAIMVGPFIVVFLEDPPIRSVLKGPAGPLGFSPSSVLGLMKVDTSKLEQVKQLAQLAKMGKISSFGSLQELTGALSGLAKQKSFNKDCFKDLEEAPLPQTPPPEAGEKGSAPEYGSDEKDSAMVNGPIVACGKENGADVLNVFDASGTKIKSILKEEFAKNPNALTDALLKADELSSKLMSLQNIDPKQWLKQAAQKAVSSLAEKLFNPRKSEDPRDSKPNAIDPNDPFYYKDPGKKKSLVDERLKKAAASVFDVGANAIGMNSSGGQKIGKQALEVEDQWGIRKVGYLPKSDANSAWNVVGGEEKNVVVAVIDSGLDMTHPDGPAYIWINPGETAGNGVDDDGNGFVDDVNGWNFLNDTNDLTDYKGHGTFVAGIIAAKRNNGIGIAGINPGVVILPIKVADEEGNTNSLSIYRAVHYAVKNGARVINISLGARGVSDMEASAIKYAHAHGIFVAIAAGNVGENIGDHGPASAPDAFTVGAMDFDGQKSTISNWGANNGLIAPGEMIYSLRSIDSFNPKKSSKDSKFYYAQSGTSFSAPMVAATASLLSARDPQLTSSEIEDILQAAADDIYAQGWDGDSGAGVLNATKTLKYAKEKFVTVKLTELRVNKNKKGDVESVDVYATVRGNFDSFTVGMGKGKRADSFKEVAGPFTQVAENAWITRIPEKLLRGSDEWVIQVEAKGKDGKPKAAQSFITLRAPKHINDY